MLLFSPSKTEKAFPSNAQVIFTPELLEIKQSNPHPEVAPVPVEPAPPTTEYRKP